MTHLWPQGEPIEVWGEEEDSPAGFVWHGVTYLVVEICARWRVHTRWWAPEQALWREYVKAVTDRGVLFLLCHDLLQGGWTVYRRYD